MHLASIYACAERIMKYRDNNNYYGSARLGRYRCIICFLCTLQSDIIKHIVCSTSWLIAFHIIAQSTAKYITDSISRDLSFVSKHCSFATYIIISSFHCASKNFDQVFFINFIQSFAWKGRARAFVEMYAASGGISSIYVVAHILEFYHLPGNFF